MRIKTAFITASFLVMLGGCARYAKMPLLPGVVARRLTPPPMDVLRIEAARIKHPILQPVEINPRKGLTPEAAAVLAVLVNPKLVAERDRKGIAAAQLLQAGILPNPHLTWSLDFPMAGALQGTNAAYGFGLSYDIRALITRGANIGAADANKRSVDLDVAWREWQVAEAAKDNVYRVLLLEKKLAVALSEEKAQKANLATVKKAVDAGGLTITRLSAAQASLARVHQEVLTTRQALDQERLALARDIGFPPGRLIRLDRNTRLPRIAGIPPVAELLKGLQERRIDLVALKMGYQSQEERVRAAVLGQFPSISLGPSHARDTTNVITTGLAADFDFPLFDRNQGTIAVERATRKQLFDEYIDRVFLARSQIAAGRKNLFSLRKRIAASKKAVLVFEDLVRTYHAAMLTGNVDALTYYNALDELITTRLAVLDLELKLVNQFIALEIESGRVFSESGRKKME